MANEKAVYFIHDCQELRDQVQRMIVEDGLYTAIKLLRCHPRGGSRRQRFKIVRKLGSSRRSCNDGTSRHVFTEVRTVITIVRVSADGVLRSRQGISLLQHSQSDH
jgi:plasmid stabilization system protein ParE